MTPDAAYAAIAERLATAAPPEAIFAASDVVAMSALRALSERGMRVPRDVAVIGFDDVMLAAHTTPALSTVRQDLVRGASVMVERLFARMAGEDAGSSVIPPELVVRASTAG
jgi:DNA-binding LacI/PurR family transcriptional regulator